MDNQICSFVHKRTNKHVDALFWTQIQNKVNKGMPNWKNNRMKLSNGRWLNLSNCIIKTFNNFWMSDLRISLLLLFSLSSRRNIKRPSGRMPEVVYNIDIREKLLQFTDSLKSEHTHFQITKEWADHLHKHDCWCCWPPKLFDLQFCEICDWEVAGIACLWMLAAWYQVSMIYGFTVLHIRLSRLKNKTLS